MVAIQETFPWYEEVRPPVDPRKTVHVVNHWRKPPNSAEQPEKDETGVQPRIVVIGNPLRG